MDRQGYKVLKGQPFYRQQIFFGCEHYLPILISIPHQRISRFRFALRSFLPPVFYPAIPFFWLTPAVHPQQPQSCYRKALN